MVKKRGPLPTLEFHALDESRWNDFEQLFGERGACGGCWCMFWRLKRSDFDRQKGEGNRTAMKAIVNSGEVPGILAYKEDRPVGWCSIAPRSSFPVLNRSRILKKIDDAPVWSVVCFFIDKAYRNKGLSVRLLKAAVDYVRQRGGTLLEGYPVEPRKGVMPPALAWTGLASAFKKAGFSEVARRSPTRPLMRFTVSRRGRKAP